MARTRTIGYCIGALSAAALVLLLAGIITAISVSSGPSITPSNAATNDSLNCSWIPLGGGTLLANVTWYNGTSAYSTENDIACVNNTLCQTPLGVLGSATMRDEKWNYTVLVHNGTENVTTSVSVNISNADPTIEPFYNVTVPEDRAYSVRINATDPESDTLTWFSNDNNYTSDLFTIDQDTGWINFTPTQSQVANHTMDIIVIDGHGGSDTFRVIYTVQEINDRPYFVPALTDQAAVQDAQFTYAIIGNDEENDTINFSLYAPSLPDLQLNWSNGTISILTFGSNGGAPQYADGGTHTVNITVYDVANTSRNQSQNITLTITTINQDPVLATMPNRTGTQGNSFSASINATDVDAGDTLSFASAVNCSLPNPWTVTTTSSAASAGEAWINVTLNNTHVVCPWVNITVSDGSVTVWQLVYLNITNTNDAPSIHNISVYTGNNAGNDLRNLSSGVGASFVYLVNATDPDTYTYENETLTYSSNDSLFEIGGATGIMSLALNTSHVGNRTVNITVTDDGGLSTSAALNISIANNTVPVFENITLVSCAEGISCTVYINAADPDDGENLTFTSNDTTRFPINYHNTTAVRFNKTFVQDAVGNYSILLNVSDMFNATDNVSFRLEVNNTNDAPFFDENFDNASDTIAFPIIVIARAFTYWINATDYDIPLGDQLNISYVVLDSVNASLLNSTQTSNNTLLVHATPSIADIGNYSINITVNDTAGLYAWQVINFTVYNSSLPPNITQIRPYYNTTLAVTLNSTVDTSFYTTTNVSVNVSENSSTLFNITAIDPDGSTDNLTILWYHEGILNKSVPYTSNTGMRVDWGFFTNGTRNVTVVVQDAYFSSTSWHWEVAVANINRAPLLITNLQNFTSSSAINSTTTFNNYFGYYDTQQHFIDPDDDLNSNNQTRDSVSDPNEKFTLTVTATTCSVATLSITGPNLTITPSSIGTCIVNFTATDQDGASLISNAVRLEVSSTATVVTTTVSSGGGGGGGGGSSDTTRTQLLPVDKPKDVPKPLEIIVPGRVVIYQNKAMRIPIVLTNTWNTTISGIQLSAVTNNTLVDMNFSTDFYPTLEPGQQEISELTVSNYREYGPYEIQIIANVTDPAFTDTGTIYINSLEEKSEGEDINTRLQFARDLLTTNVECQELNELLDKADVERAKRNYDTAINIVDSVVNGCKYLISTTQNEPDNQQPLTFALFSYVIPGNIVLIAMGVIGLLIFVALIMLILMQRRTKED
ncbi:MAG: putative Ig domain-containing protein [Nanoarchaeota archaeon]